MTYYTDAAGGAGVLDTGTTNWIPALADRSGCDARDRPGSSTGNSTEDRTGSNTGSNTGDRLGGKTAAGPCASAIVRRITGNILRAFGTGPAGHRHPSVPNWRRITGQ
jgi:hypothetical protein